MRVSIEKEHDNFRQTMELDDEITAIDADMGLLRIYINTGDNPTHFASCEFTKKEMEALIKKYTELKSHVKNGAE